LPASQWFLFYKHLMVICLSFLFLKFPKFPNSVR
jgi:hypothetical protein